MKILRIALVIPSIALTSLGVYASSKQYEGTIQALYRTSIGTCQVDLVDDECTLTTPGIPWNTILNNQPAYQLTHSRCAP